MRVKWTSWAGKCYLTDDTKIPADDVENIKYKEVTATLKFLKKAAYNYLFISQEDTVYFHIHEEGKTKSNNFGDARQAWVTPSRKFEPTTGNSKRVVPDPDENLISVSTN